MLWSRISGSLSEYYSKGFWLPWGLIVIWLCVDHERQQLIFHNLEMGYNFVPNEVLSRWSRQNFASCFLSCKGFCCYSLLHDMREVIPLTDMYSFSQTDIRCHHVDVTIADRAKGSLSLGHPVVVVLIDMPPSLLLWLHGNHL